MKKIIEVLKNQNVVAAAETISLPDERAGYSTISTLVSTVAFNSYQGYSNERNTQGYESGGSPHRGRLRAASPLLRNLPCESCAFFGACRRTGAPDMISPRMQGMRLLPTGGEITSDPRKCSGATSRRVPAPAWASLRDGLRPGTLRASLFGASRNGERASAQESFCARLIGSLSRAGR